MIFTVGHEGRYDRLMSRGVFMKQGRLRNYPGGLVFRTAADARRYMLELGQHDGWAVYEVDADWEHDTKMSEHGWWHALIRDSVVTRKVVE